MRHVHLNRVTPTDLHNASAMIVTTRDPVDRVISAFNWRHPRFGSSPKRFQPFGRECDREQAQAEENVYKCFDTVNDFARSLDDHTWCGLVARTTLQHGVGHIGRGFSWYLAQSLPLILNSTVTRRLHLTHVETLQEDVAAVARSFTIRGDVSLQFYHKQMQVQSMFPNSTVDRHGREMLQRVLADDYYILSQLERRVASDDF